MDASTFCANHPTKQAVNECKKCGKPICRACTLQTEIGLFCSQECYEAMKQFQEHVGALGRGRGTPGFGANLMAWLKQLVGAAILLGIVYAVFYFQFGATTPGEIVEVIKGWF